MSNPKGRALPEIISLFLVMLVIYCLDVFFVKSDLTVLGDNFYSRFISFTVIFMLIFFKREHINSFGLKKDKKKFVNALIFGAVFSIVPIVCACLIEYIFFKAFSPDDIMMSFFPPTVFYTKSGTDFPIGICILIYAFTSLLASLFKETFFRGFLLHKFKRLMPFISANIFQALLYTSFVIPKLIRNFTKGYFGKGVIDIAAFVIIFYLVHEFLTGIKWGMMTKVSGSVYMSVVDDFLYVFLGNCIHIVDPTIKWAFMAFMLVAQIISFVLVTVYCYRKTGSLSQFFKDDIKTGPDEPDSHAKKESQTAEPEPNGYSADIIKDMQNISPDQFKSIVEPSFAFLGDTRAHNGDLSEKEIDEFLKGFSKPKHRYSPPQEAKPVFNPIKDKDFDVDSFLKDYSNN